MPTPSAPSSPLEFPALDHDTLRSAFAAMSDGVVLQVRDGSIRAWNPAAERILGLTGDQLVGRTSVDPCWRAVKPDGSPFPGEEHPAMVALRTGQPVSDVVMGVHKPDASLTWIRIASTPVFADGDPRPTSTVTTFADITDLQRERAAHAATARQLELAVESSETGLWDWDMTTGVTDFSDRWSAMLGFAPGDIVPHVDTFYRLVHPADARQVQCALDDHFDGRTPYYRVEVRMRTKAGGFKWVLAAGAVVARDAEGRPLRMIGTHVDIDRMKATEQRFRVIFERSSDPLLIVRDRVILDCNRAAALALGAPSPEAVLDLHTDDISGTQPPEHLQRRRAIEAAASAGTEGDAATDDSYRLQWIMKRRDGSEFLADVRLAGVTIGDRKALIVSFHDLTERVRHEQALRDAAEAADAANRAKSDFLARMSHELRTPLNSIIGFSRLLANRSDRSVHSVQREYLERIHANGVHLLGIINDILDLSKVESGRLEAVRESVALDALVLATTAQLEDQARARSIALVCELPPSLAPLTTDDGKLRQVLINLVGNAIKFTERGEVRIRVTSNDGVHASCVEVRDTGIGIAAERFDAIFQPFEQGETSTSRRFGGTGLGLAISRQLCHLMGYRLTVASTPGAGSVFTIELAPPGS